MTLRDRLPERPLSRRALLGAAGLGGASLAVPGLDLTADAVTTPAVPAAAARAGYRKLVFRDEFTTWHTIDLTGTGVRGKQWYVDLPWGLPQTPRQDLRMAGSVLTITQSHRNQNIALTTVSARSRQGRSWGHGYFEARMRFDPRLGAGTDGYPSFWSVPRGQIHGALRQHGEIDIFEAYHKPWQHYTGHFAGTVHDAVPRRDGTWNYDRQQTMNNVVNVKNTTTAWHTYAVLWEPWRLTWFYDGRVMTSVSYGKDRLPNAPTWNPLTGERTRLPGTFSVVERHGREGIALILGSGTGWPLEVDWVRVWQP